LNIMFPVLLRMFEIFFVAFQRPAFLLEDVADPLEDGRKLDVCFQLSWPGSQLLLHWYWHLAANASPFLDMFIDALTVAVWWISIVSTYPDLNPALHFEINLI